MELILHPVPVWDGGGAVSQTVALDGGGDIVVRVRSTSILDRAYVRMGLFWHSRREIIFVPVEVLGPPAKTAAGADCPRATMSRCCNRRRAFILPPAVRALNYWAEKKPSTAAFEMTPETLAAIATAARAEAVIETNRGNLAVALDAATGDVGRRRRRRAPSGNLACFWSGGKKILAAGKICGKMTAVRGGHAAAGGRDFLKMG